MTREEAVQFKTQWSLVNLARIEEVRRMSSAEKVHDLEMLFEFGQSLGWSVPTGGEGWEYWSRLKELYDV